MVQSTIEKLHLNRNEVHRELELQWQSLSQESGRTNIENMESLVSNDKAFCRGN